MPHGSAVACPLHAALHNLEVLMRNVPILALLFTACLDTADDAAENAVPAANTVLTVERGTFFGECHGLRIPAQCPGGPRGHGVVGLAYHH